MPTEIDAVLNMIDRISKLGYPATLVFIIFLGARGVWVFGWILRAQIAMYDKLLAESKDREDAWKDLALTGRELARTGTQVAKTAAEHEKRR